LPNSDAVGFSPPLMISEAEIDQVVEALGRALGEVRDELVREKVAIS
jgi:L-2,4-diaminobutyrate transaminase